MPIWQLLSLENFRQALTRPANIRSIQNTLLLAVVGGAFALVAYHSTFRFRGPLKYIALMPLYRE